MVNTIIMPKAGMSMEEGKIIKWLVREGERVNAGDVILEIETDKTSMEVEASGSGTVLKIIAQEGETVPVTQAIGYIGKPGEAIPSETDKPTGMAGRPEAEKPAAEKQKDTVRHEAAAPLKNGGKIPATPFAKTLAKERHIALADIAPGGARGEIKAKDVLAAGKRKVTPLARKIAGMEGIDLKQAGAEGGRIFSANVRELMETATASKGETLGDGDVKKPLSGMRKVIAQRMAQSHMEVPPVTLDTKADVTGLLRDRQEVNARGGEKISINDYVMVACAQALAAMPHMNCSFAGDGVIRRLHINIGCAVALDEGLIVPVVRDADRLSLEGISKSVKELAGRARNGKLSPDEYSGGTFTVSNLGMYGITFFTPIINLPESMILGVCAVEKIFRMLPDGALGNRDVMGLSLTFDHRVHDGASAAVFLKKIVELLESYNGKAGER